MAQVFVSSGAKRQARKFKLFHTRSLSISINPCNRLDVMKSSIFGSGPDLNRIKNTLKQPVIVDGRNIYDPLALTEAGFSYYGIGRTAPTAPVMTVVSNRNCA